MISEANTFIFKFTNLNMFNNYQTTLVNFYIFLQGFNDDMQGRSQHWG